MDGNMVQKETFGSHALVRLEIQIAEYFAGAARNLLGVGRCLNEARENDLVPHGQWEAWVRKTTGMEIRKAQRLMQAAREVQEGSVLSSLPMSKITAILALPEAQREEVAQQTKDESLTVKELQAKIDELNGRAKNERAAHQREITKWINTDTRHVHMVDELNRVKAEQEARIQELEGSIATLLESQAKVIDEEVSEKVADLRAELEEAKAFAARQAQLRQEAQQEMLNASMGQRAAAPELPRFDAGTLSAAVRGFIGEVGVMPHMAAELSGLGSEERGVMRRALNQVEDWLIAARKALGAEVINV